MDEFSKGGVALILEVVVSIGIIAFLFWYFYQKNSAKNVPDTNINTGNYQQIIDSARQIKCLSEAQDQQEKDNCSVSK